MDPLLIELYEHMMEDVKVPEEQAAMMVTMDRESEYLLQLGRIVGRAYVTVLHQRILHPDWEVGLQIKAWIVSLDEVTGFDPTDRPAVVTPPQFAGFFLHSPRRKEQLRVFAARLEAAIAVEPTFGVNLEISCFSDASRVDAEAGEVEAFARLTRQIDFGKADNLTDEDPRGDE